MKAHTIFLSTILAVYFLLNGNLSAFGAEDAIETVTYNISPLGSCEYRDLGLTELGGRKVNLVIFKTDVFGLKDTERIYSDPKTYLPLRVERDVSLWLSEEDIIEEYRSKENSLIITKFKEGKKINEYLFKSDRPIHNAILLPFSLRKEPKLKIGWSAEIRLPDKIKVELVSMEDVTVPAGIFKAYRFTSDPHKFDIWISADKLRVPLKIKGLGAFSYTLVMQKHVFKDKK